MNNNKYIVGLVNFELYTNWNLLQDKRMIFDRIDVARLGSTSECQEKPASKILEIIQTSKSGLDSLKASADRTKAEIDTKQKTAAEADKAMVETIIANKEQVRGNLPADLIFEIQRIEPGAAMEIFTKALTVPDGDLTHEVTFTSNANGTATKNQWAEKKIGLAMLGPWQSTFKSKSTDGVEKKGERRGLTGSFFQGASYIEILEGYKIPNPNLPYKSDKNKETYMKEYEAKKTEALGKANDFLSSHANKTVIEGGTETMSQILDKRCENSTEIIKRVYELGYLNDIDPQFLLSLLTSSEKGQEFQDFLDIAQGEEFGLEARLYLLIRSMHIVQQIYEAGGKKAFTQDLKISEEFALYFISNFLDHDKAETKEKSLKIFGIYNSLSPTNKMPENITALNQSLDKLETAPKPGERSGDFETSGRKGEDRILTFKKTRRKDDLQTLKDIPENTPINQLSFNQLCAVTRAIFGDGPGAQLLIDTDVRFGSTGRIIITEIAIAKHEGNFNFGSISNDISDTVGDVARGTFQICDKSDKKSLTKYRRTFWNGVRYAKEIGHPITLNNGEYVLKAPIAIVPPAIPGNLSPADVDIISHIGYLWKEIAFRWEGRGKEPAFEDIANPKFTQELYIDLVHHKIQGGADYITDPKTGNKIPIIIGKDVYDMGLGGQLKINTTNITFVDKKIEAIKEEEKKQEVKINEKDVIKPQEFMTKHSDTVFFGDSLTAGYTNYLSHDAIGGQGTNGMRKRMEETLYEREKTGNLPKEIVILGGTNGVGSSINDIEAMVKMAKAKNIEVVLGTIPPMGDWFDTRDWKIKAVYRNDKQVVIDKVNRFNAGINEIAAKYGLKCIDFYAALENPSKAGHTDHRYLDTTDEMLLHMNPTGNGLMRQMIDEALTPQPTPALP